MNKHKKNVEIMKKINAGEEVNDTEKEHINAVLNTTSKSGPAIKKRKPSEETNRKKINNNGDSGKKSTVGEKTKKEAWGKKEINHALVEEKRPPIYTAMKYWGKKPHNIWREYIKAYTPPDGVVLDPFVGSNIASIEAKKAKRRAIGFDINPLSSFFLEVFASKFDEEKFKQAAKKIIEKIQGDATYEKYYTTTCRQCGYKKANVKHFKWKNDKIYQIGIECPQCKKQAKKNDKNITKTKLRELNHLSKPNKGDENKAKSMEKIKIKRWYPKKKFHESMSISASAIKNLGGASFNNLWTQRNLFVLSEIFYQIRKVKNEDVKKQLLYGFVQSIHLTTKMCIPRREKSGRLWSTSWGRSAYICSARKMEMNPLDVFASSCFGKQSVTSSMKGAEEYFPEGVNIKYVDESNKSNRSKNFDIKYGTIDVNNITDYIDAKSVDFIITDPPYGGLVQYLDLSTLFLIWLEKIDGRFAPNYSAEITHDKKQDIDLYKRKFLKAVQNLYEILKDDGKIVFTFHNKDIKIWNAFLRALHLSGFRIEKVIHQQNKRTGESNVGNPYGTSASDFYIRCVKDPITRLETDDEKFEEFVVRKTIQLIAQRNEPTPYQILFNGLLVEISQAGFDLEDFDINIENILKKYQDKIFTIESNKLSNAGKMWWFKEPEKYIKHPDRMLTDRVETTVLSLLKQKVSVSFDEVLGKVFTKYPNGMTPDIKSIRNILEIYANKSSGKWIIKKTTKRKIEKHSEIIYKMVEIGKKLGYKTYIGKREQGEKYKEKNLGFFADVSRIKGSYTQKAIKRIEMIDVLWLDEDGEIQAAIEVENTTNFTSGIQRGSNLEKNVKKIMVVPNKREKKIKKISDPYFIKGFDEHNWKYITYADVERILSAKEISEDALEMYEKTKE